MFLAINVMAMIYACIQVFQFRGFGDECPAITNVGYFALINVSVHECSTTSRLGAHTPL